MSYRYIRNKIEGRILRLSAPRKKNKGGNLIAWKKKQEDTRSLNQPTTSDANNSTDFLQKLSSNGDAGANMHTTPKPAAERTGDSGSDVNGKRIVDIAYFISEMQLLNKHSTIGCTLSEMEIISEKRRGVISGIKMKCKMCSYSKVVWTERLESSEMNSNAAAVAGIMKIGGGYSNMEEFLSTLNIPSMSVNTFAKQHEDISKAWEATAVHKMQLAADEEKLIAIKRGNVDKNGVPLLTVVVDGSWAKRSYRTNYASLSGVAAILGYETKKVLFLGVRNKYCCICARAAAKEKTTAENHQCFKNWSGSSSGMEADIIVEGFARSIEMYGLKYSRFIGDGDSNVYKNILDSRPYDDITVEKIECKNHLMRNTCNKLKDLAKSSKHGHITLRKIIAERILSIRRAVIMAARYRKSENDKSKQYKIFSLRDDILNAPLHVFGDHKKCESYFCNKTKPGKNYVQPLKDSGLFFRIMEVMNQVADHSKSLLFDVNNNAVEEFNSIIAKFVGGKRINFCLKGSYQARCNAAVVSHNADMPFYKLHKQISNNSPGKHSKISEERKQIRRARESKYKKNCRRKRLFQSSTSDTSYGRNAAKPDLDFETLRAKKESFLRSLYLNASERDKLFEETTLQSMSPIWMEERRKRLTSSNFGVVCNKLPYTKCDSIVKRILYSNIETPAMRYGKTHEREAITSLKKLNIDIKPCGIVIDEELPFFASTPDGILDDNGIVEIKCPASCSELSPEEAILSRRVTFWTVEKNRKIIGEINQKHAYYFQVQGQLHISKRNYCLFVLWTPMGMKMEKINRDTIFWESHMKEKLVNFYIDCLLPELLDPRYSRSLPIRNPEYILTAQKLKEKERQQKMKNKKI